MRDVESLPEDFVDNFYGMVGLNVKKIREKKGLTQLKLSQMMGHKSVTIVSRAEIFYKGQHFNLEHLAKIAYILEVDICTFFMKPSDT